MEPLLHENDLVYFEKIKQVKVNDIVLIKKKQLFIHRVIYKNSRYFVTKGDNNLISDGKIKPNQIFGRVVKVKRGKYSYKPENVYLIQSSLYLKEIIKIKNLLEKNKIEYVFLKGLPLHLSFEKTHPKRVYADCDVLVDKKDFLKAENILLKHGYKKQDSSFSKAQKNIKDKESELVYFKIINGFTVMFDLHLEVVFMMTQISKLESLYPQILVDRFTSELLKTKRTIIINRSPFFILDTKYLILYLSLHFFHHNFHGVFRLDFLDKVIRKSRLSTSDWKNIASTINHYQLTNFVYPVFLLLRKYYNTPFPGSFRVTMKQLNNETISRYLKVNIFNDESRIQAGVNRFKNIFVLSPHPLWKKMLVFADLRVIYLLFFVLKLKLSYFLKDFLKNHQHLFRPFFR